MAVGRTTTLTILLSILRYSGVLEAKLLQQDTLNSNYHDVKLSIILMLSYSRSN